MAEFARGEVDVEETDDPLPASSFGNIGRFVRVDWGKGDEPSRWWLLKIPFSEEDLGWVEATSLRVFLVDVERDSFELVEESGVDLRGGFVYANIERPGIYGVYGLPGHPAVRETLHLFCRFRVELQANPQGPLQRSICQWILCDPGWGSQVGFDMDPIPPGGLRGHPGGGDGPGPYPGGGGPGPGPYPGGGGPGPGPYPGGGGPGPGPYPGGGGGRPPMMPGNVCELCYGIRIPRGGLPECRLLPRWPHRPADQPDEEPTYVKPCPPKTLNSGQLDPSFGTGGVISSVFPVPQSDANAVVVTKDGKLLVAGRAAAAHLVPGAGVARFLPDGKLDPSFGVGGKATFLPTTGGAHALALQPDGKCVVAGDTVTSASFDFALTRLDAAGKLDPGFGTGGTVAIPSGPGADSAYDVAVDPKGNVVACGTFASQGGNGSDFALVRVDQSGVLDPGFGAGGKVITSLGPSFDIARAMAIQSDGKIVVGGWSIQSGARRWAIVRYDHTGTLDPSFGSGGVSLLSVDGEANDLVVLPDGTIVAAGYRVGPGGRDDFCLVRLKADGTLDGGFGTGGIVTTSLTSTGADHAFGLAVQDARRILVAGFANESPGPKADIAVARYLLDGSLDATFGSGGFVTTAVGTERDYAYDVAIDPDCRIVVVGYTSHSKGLIDWALVSYAP